MEDTPRYKAFGELLIKYRKEIGITQAEFARLIKSTQQTVCRWEQGDSRPREKQMPLIASVLKLVKSGEADSEELLIAAGYLNKRIVTTTFDQPFPLDSLGWETFQRFSITFLKSLYRKDGGVVHPNGSRGHSQNGFDIDVIFPDNTMHQFDCKREKRFTKTDVNNAIKKNVTKADKKFLLLAYSASSTARKEIKKHAPLWDIWDVEDISDEIRQNLTKAEQIKLIDRYFPGQRFALLGEFEAGPWQTSEEFFKPFIQEHHPFSHKWSLVGRDSQVQEMLGALSDPNKKLIFIIGTGGVGKSRFLKELIEKHQSISPELQVLFLSLTETITNKNFEDIGKNKKILVIDDAHDATLENIQRLLQYAADLSNNTKLIFALRNYGIDLIKHQASLNFPIEEKYVSEIYLKPLNLKNATELATQVLKEFNGHIEFAENIATFTKDCALATVIGSKIVAQEKIHVEFAKNKEAFYSVFKAKFCKVLIGDIGRKGDEEKIRKILNFIALIQPFNEFDKSVPELIEQIERIPFYEVNRIISLLSQNGVLLKRAEMYRIIPDMLADFIIDETCRVEYNGASTGYAEKVLDKSGDMHLKHVLVNLAKLDWRLTEGEPNKSKLLNSIWTKLNSADYIDAVTAIAYYQSKRALKFVENIMTDGEYHSNLPELIKYAAYNLDQLESACMLLWELSKREKKVRQYNTGHAIQVLSELCEVKPNKVREFSEKVVDFGLFLLEQDDSWSCPYTPFDVLKSILQTEGRIYKLDMLNYSVNTFSINIDFVKELRAKVINATVALLAHSNINRAVLAARFLRSAISYQRPMIDDEKNKWAEEFVLTLKKIEKAIQENSFHKLVLIQIADSVSWHVKYGKGETQIIAEQIIKLLPDSLDFRITDALINAHPHRKYVVTDLALQEIANKELLENLTKELISTYPDGELLREYLESISLDIKLNFSSESTSPFLLYEYLIKAHRSFARAILENALKNPRSEIEWIAGVALSVLLKNDYEYGIKVASQFFTSEIGALQISVAYGYCGFSSETQKYTQNDIELLKKLLTSDNEQVVLGAVSAIRWPAKSNPQLVIELLLSGNIGLSEKIADQALFLFQEKDIPFHLLTQEEVFYFLDQLEKIPELDGHWIETFLANASKSHARVIAKFFMNRVERAVVIKSWQYRPCNYGPYNHVPLRLCESTEYMSVFRGIFEWWMNSNNKDDYFFHENAAHLFDALFSPFNSEIVGFLWESANTGSPAVFRIISKILGEAQNDFVFSYQTFVTLYLQKAKQFKDKDCYDYAVSTLFSSAVSGVRSGSPGQPFSRDIEMKKLSEKVLSEIPKYSPAYLLYEQLKESAEESIKRSNKDREYFLENAND